MTYHDDPERPAKYIRESYIPASLSASSPPLSPVAARYPPPDPTADIIGVCK